MGVYRTPLNNGDPNEKPYHLRYADDGTQFSVRDRGGAQREFTLPHAITLADAYARDFELCVVDPETEAVLWRGRTQVRSAL